MQWDGTGDEMQWEVYWDGTGSIYLGFMMEKHKTRIWLHRGGQSQIYFDAQSNHDQYIEFTIELIN